MISPRYARVAARLVAREAAPEVEPTLASRAHAVAVIAHALVAKHRRHALRVRIAGGCLVAAAAMLGFVSVRRLSRPAAAASSQAISAVAELSGPGASIVVPAGARAPRTPWELPQGGRLIVNGSGSATVQLSTGTRLAVEHDSSLELENAGAVQRFFLAQGSLQAKVAKLGSAQRFIVRTPDTEVEVRGTIFRVTIVPPDPSCGAGTQTRVSVDEGLVEVRRAASTLYVHAGETWPSHCEPSAPAALVAALVPQTAGRPKRVAWSGGAPHRSSATDSANSASAATAASDAPSTKSSSLSQQIELFARATAAGRQGDAASAVSAYELFAARYPASPLAESAAVHRLRLLRSIDPAAARLAAREYLSRYPGGYAKNDAEKLLQQP